MKPKTLFVREGYNLHSSLSQDIWLVSRILSCNPFSDEILQLTQAQIDFIIGMYALSNPDIGKTIRPDLFENTQKIEKEVAWLSALPEKALKQKLGLDNPNIRKLLEKKG